MGPVFLLDMGVIVLVIGPASGELNGLVSLVKVSHQMPIQKLRAVIAVEAKQREREGIFDILDLPQDICFPFTPDRPLLCPAGGNIDGVYGIGKLAEETLPAMGNGIGLQESRFCLIPLVGFNGDLFSQEGARFRGGSSPASVFYPGRF